MTQLTALAAVYSAALYAAVVNAFKPIAEKYGVDFNPAPAPANSAPAKPSTPSTPSTDAANDKFQGLTFLPIARVMVQAITQKLAELDKNITIDFHDTFAVVVNFDKKAGRNFRVKFPTNSGSEDDTLAKFALADYKWWTMTNIEIKTLTKENGAAGMVVCTAKTFYTKAAQYLGLMKISPTIERASDPVKTGLCLPGFEEKHPTTNLPPRPVIPAITGDTDAAPDVDTPTERGECMHMSVVDWQDAFDAIQQLAPAKYSVKVYGDSSILYAADNGYGFEILTIGGADAIVGKTMLIGKQIQRVTFGRVENGLLQVVSATDKLISFSKGFPSVAKKQDYLDWMGLPANDTFAPAELGKPFELARASRTIKEKLCRETIEGTQYSFSDAAKKFFKGNGKILADSQFLFHTASDVVKYIVIEDAPFNNGRTEDSLALVPGDTKGSLVNPNGGEPFIEGVEHINFCTGGVTALEYIDLPIFASGKRITKIEFIPAIKSARRA